MSDRVIVLVTGGRCWSQATIIHDHLNSFARKYGRTKMVVVHGAARGADSIAWKWAESEGVENVQFYPDWEQHGKKAGHLRNQRMVDFVVAMREAGDDVVGLAFPDAKSRGTWDCVRRMERAHIPVTVVSDEGVEPS